ncbi:MAG: hypothetical protein F6J87_26275, partial [Spirulina sp. SIO3F2]|nr:hypothetical protein [Spirulina sp. SIO3F2]
AGAPAESGDRSDQILQVLQGLNQRLARIEEREAHFEANLDARLAATATAAPAQPDERIEQVLQWLQVIGQKLQRLEAKEEEPMITQAELVAPDERIDQILQMMQGLGQQVQELEAHTEDAIASLRPSLEASAEPAIVVPPDSSVTSSSSQPSSFTMAPAPIPLSSPQEQPISSESPAVLSSPEPDTGEIDGLVQLEQIYHQTQLNRQSIQFFASYLGISEIEALETRTHWEYDYIAGGFRRR